MLGSTESTVLLAITSSVPGRLSSTGKPTFTRVAEVEGISTRASSVLLRINLVNGSPERTTSPTFTETSATVPPIGDFKLL